MKRVRLERPSIAVVFLVVLACIAAARPVGIFVARVALKSVFCGSQVKVEAVRFYPLGRCTISGISVTHPQYHVTVRQVTAAYSARVLTGLVSSVTVDDAAIAISLGTKDVSSLRSLFPARVGGPGLVRFREIELRRAQIKLQSRDVNAVLLVTLKADGLKRQVQRLDAALDSLSYAGCTVERASLTALQGEETGLLYCGAISYGKISARNLESPVGLQANTLSFPRITAALFGGKLLGKIDVTLGLPVSYRLAMRARGVEFADVVKQLKVEDKFTASGPLEGTLLVEGAGSMLGVVDGDFHAAQPGVLSIRDRRIIENIGKTMPQRMAADLLMETLKNYKYNTCTIRTGMSEEGLTCGMVFEAEAGGKIAFTVVVHPAVHTP
jgi:hypothetical protein